MFELSIDSIEPVEWATNLLVLGATAGMFVLLSRPVLSSSRAWRATVTPLASIIGSGFLVVAPLLGYTVGRWALVAMLGIIAGFLIGLVVVNVNALLASTWTLARLTVDWNMETLRKLLGAFLIVQGFETSRYMGTVYSRSERIVTMRYAQLLSAVIYVVFIGLASVLLGTMSTISETGVITLSAQVAFIVPLLLVIGAAAAQFSAAVADTLVSGGLVEAATYGKVDHRYVYLAVMAVALVLLWTSHIFAIIAYASRAFAAYYAIQCAMAAAHSRASDAGPRSTLRAIWFGILSLSMILTAIFAIPAESISE